MVFWHSLNLEMPLQCVASENLPKIVYFGHGETRIAEKPDIKKQTKVQLFTLTINFSEIYELFLNKLKNSNFSKKTDESK